MPSLEEIIRLDKEDSEARCRPKEVAVLPMKLVDALYIAINALDPIGEQYSREDKQRAKSEPGVVTTTIGFLFAIIR